MRRELYQRAILESFVKLNPRWMVRNPVMFVVEVGSVLTTLLWIQALFGRGEAPAAFIGAVTIWLWFTVLFANFAEAVAEGRGKAQAEALRRTRHQTQAKKLTQPVEAAAERPADRSRRHERRAAKRPSYKYETVSSAALRRGDVVLVEAGDTIPADGEVIVGIASVDESAITGESAPVIREAGGDRSAVTGGTRLLSDWLVVRVSADPGEGFLDRMISLDRGRETPEDAERDRTEHPAGRFHHHLPDRVRDPAALFDLQRQRRRSGYGSHDYRAHRAAGLPDPDDHRRPALGHRHRRDGPHDPAQRDCHVGPGRGSSRRRGCAAAGQDGHDHARQPPGGGVHPGESHRSSRPRRSGAACLAG